MKEVLEASAALWAGLLEKVTPAELDQPSGLGDWTTRQLVDHVIGGADRTGILLRGGTSADTAGTRDLDYIGDDALASFWMQESRMNDAAAKADLSTPVDYRLGVRTGEAVMAIRVLELALHSKDLADAIGAEWNPPDAVVDFLLGEGSPVLEEFREAGAVGPALPVEADAPPAERLLAFAGRASR